MDIFAVLMLVGGLALFLFGMELMGDGLKRVSGGKLESILEKLTSNPIKGVLLGAAVTGVIQSSSATTVMVVGFVNSGIMQLENTVGVIMGANIGTTVTSWLLSLTGIQGDSIWMKFLEPTSFSPILAMIGVIFYMFLKDEKKKNLGTIFIGFAILMFGMDQMSNSVAPLADIPEFRELMVKFANPLYGLLAGTILTAIIQSSSASVGILQALCATGAVPFSVAIPIIMGQNIGTCITAILASIGASKNSKRTACIHLFFNMIGTGIFMVVFYTLNMFMHFAFLQDAASVVGIAVIHSAFNVSATLVLLPFSKCLVKLACLALPDKDDDEENKIIVDLLDERFLDKPGYAVKQAQNVALYIAGEMRKVFVTTASFYQAFEKDGYRALKEKEGTFREYSQKLSQYLMKISGGAVSPKDSYMIDSLLQCLGDFERIWSHTYTLAQTAKRIKADNLIFSKQAQGDLNVLFREITELLELVEKIIKEGDEQKCQLMQIRRADLMSHLKKMKKGHIKRLRKEKCTTDVGVVFVDILFNCEGIIDHCVNVSECIAQSEELAQT